LQEHVGEFSLLTAQVVQLLVDPLHAAHFTLQAEQVFPAFPAGSVVFTNNQPSLQAVQKYLPPYSILFTVVLQG
jgi:hypothetical protein